MRGCVGMRDLFKFILESKILLAEINMKDNNNNNNNTRWFKYDRD